MLRDKYAGKRKLKRLAIVSSQPFSYHGPLLLDGISKNGFTLPDVWVTIILAIIVKLKQAFLTLCCF